MSKKTSSDPGRRSNLPRIILTLLALVAVAGVALLITLQNQSAQIQSYVNESDRLLKAGRVAEAENIAKSVVQNFPANASAWELLARIYVGTQRYNEATDALRHLTKLKPDTPGFYARLAEMLRRTGDNAGALQQAQEALKRDPNDAAALMTTALALRTAGQGAQELTYYRRLVQHNPDNPDYLMVLASSLMQYGSYIEALPLLEKITRLVPNKPEGHSLLGEALYYMDQSPAGLAKSEAELQAALQIAPNNYGPNLCLGRVYLRLQYPEKALPCLIKAQKASQDSSDVHFALSQAYEMTGQKTLADAARKKFLEVRQRQDQENELQKRLTLNPRDFDDNLKLGEIKIQKRDLRAAEYYLAHAQQLQPTNPELNTAIKQLTSLMPGANGDPSRPSGGN